LRSEQESLLEPKLRMADQLLVFNTTDLTFLALILFAY
jgi:hypothetical protein